MYQLSMELGEKVWKMVETWNYFQKDTIGKQLVKSVDSIAANISEGYGRFHFKETKQFAYYSRGSLYETRTWLAKARSRNLIDDGAYKKIIENIDTMTPQLNGYIRSLGKYYDK